MILKNKLTALKGGAVKAMILAGAYCLPISAAAQTTLQTSQVNTALPMLRMAPDARAASMGETGIATTPDAASVFYNPSKIAFDTKPVAVSLDYLPWLREITSGMYLMSLGMHYKLDDKQALAGSFRYFNTGKIEERSSSDELLQLISPNELALDASYIRTLSSRISLGITFRYIRSAIGRTMQSEQPNAHNGMGADISGFYNGRNDKGEGFTAGAIIANLGTAKVKYGGSDLSSGYMPARIGLGLGYTFVLQDDHKILLATDFNKSLVPLVPEGDDGMNTYQEYSTLTSYGKGLTNGAMSNSIGAEYSYKDFLRVSAGYYLESEAYGGRKYLSAGLGVTHKQVGFNFAYIFPSGELTAGKSMSNTLRIGFFFTPEK